MLVTVARAFCRSNTDMGCDAGGLSENSKESDDECVRMNDGHISERDDATESGGEEGKKYNKPWK